jgi:hypothetical protein
MAQPEVPEERALAIPGKISREIRERHRFVSEPAKGGVADHFRSKAIRPKIYRARDFDQGR